LTRDLLKPGFFFSNEIYPYLKLKISHYNHPTLPTRPCTYKQGWHTRTDRCWWSQMSTSSEHGGE